MGGSHEDLSREIESVLAALEFLGGSGIDHVPVPHVPAPRGPAAAASAEEAPGTGKPGVRVMFVGSAPDHASVRSGRPFSEDGEEGELLARMITPMGLTGGEVRLTYAVKRVPVEGGEGGGGGRGGEPDPESLRSDLAREISEARPSVIITLGERAAEVLLGKRGLKGLRGTFHSYGEIPVMATHEPATLLKTPALKGQAWEDLKKVMLRLGLKAPR